MPLSKSTLATTPCELAAHAQFHKKLKSHASQFQSGPHAVRIRQCRSKGTVTLGEALEIPECDVHHVIDSEAMLAISYAIEDLASEVRAGELIATFQDFKNFEPQRDRYQSLAEDLDAVRVWGSGPPPKKCGKVDFISTEENKIRKYWIVLFESPNARCMLLCKQINRSNSFLDKKFIGFYTFNPYLVQSTRWRFNLLSSGLAKVITHWEKFIAFPDLKMRDLDAYLKKNEE